MADRIRLKKGIQKKLIETAKEQTNLPWKELGEKVGVSGVYLNKDLKNGRILLPERTYKRLCKLTNINYDRHILEILPANWGQKKGGKASTPTYKKERLLTEKYSSELAEIIGILLGDGNSWSKPGFYYVRVCGHSEDDREYLVNFVKPLFKKVFGVSLNEYVHPTQKELFLTLGNKNLVYTLKHFGFPPGHKIRNNVEIPKWILESESYLKACIRGLIDTDGSVCPITGRNYPYIWLTSSIPNLRTTFQKAMNILGFDIAKWSKKQNPQTFIAKKVHIQKYYKEVGFNNPKHIRRYNIALVV
tara:strand:+ start:697 stop:1605 length:909 start_codon:yes stop_codon:yes gene_type:complete